MKLPPRLLDEIYRRAMTQGGFYVELGDLSEVQRVIAQRFVDAIDEVMLEEVEGVVDDA